jgi:hypothetical protein
MIPCEHVVFYNSRGESRHILVMVRVVASVTV